MSLSISSDSFKITTHLICISRVTLHPHKAFRESNFSRLPFYLNSVYIMELIFLHAWLIFTFDNGFNKFHIIRKFFYIAGQFYNHFFLLYWVPRKTSDIYIIGQHWIGFSWVFSSFSGSISLYYWLSQILHY